MRSEINKRRRTQWSKQSSTSSLKTATTTISNNGCLLISAHLSDVLSIGLVSLPYFHLRCLSYFGPMYHLHYVSDCLSSTRDCVTLKKKKNSSESFNLWPRLNPLTPTNPKNFEGRGGEFLYDVRGTPSLKFSPRGLHLLLNNVVAISDWSAVGQVCLF